jgi:S1-C subfamily serine protease
LPVESGVLIVSFENNTNRSPAKESGLLTGDVIVNFDGQPIQGIDDLHKLLTDERIGKQTPVMVIRGTQKLTLTVVPRESR